MQSKHDGSAMDMLGMKRIYKERGQIQCADCSMHAVYLCHTHESGKFNYHVSLVSHVRLCILKAALKDKVSITDFWMQVDA